MLEAYSLNREVVVFRLLLRIIIEGGCLLPIMVAGFKVSQFPSASEVRLVSVFANVLTFLGIILVDQRVGTVLKNLLVPRVV